MTHQLTERPPVSEPTPVETVAVRFAGDSGDGMQLAGGQFTSAAAIRGNDFATFPDYPAEIRAPRGTTFGVSGFQVHFAAKPIHTPGDAIDVLVAMNPAAFKMNVGDVRQGGMIIADEDEFTKVNLKKAGYGPEESPLADEILGQRYRIITVPLSRMVREALSESGQGVKEIDRCRNMFALGLVCWMYDRPLEPTINWLQSYFGDKKNRPEVADMNVTALKTGWAFGETTEAIPQRYAVAAAELPSGRYRKISGNEALVLGLVVAGKKAGKQVSYCGYPITPASDLLHGLANLKRFGVQTFQAEDEIAAVASAIGVSYAGGIGVTGTSGPGLALKGEALGLAVMLELPIVVVDVQRAGPATGMPTKTEQTDLLQAFYGRSGEAPCIVLAASSPSDCFETAIEAVRLATRAMCPAILLSDASIANGAEPWMVPDVSAIPEIEIIHPEALSDSDEPFEPYLRNEETGARRWAIPGTPGLEHRVGGLEKQDITGDVSYDGPNHQKMLALRAEKIAKLANVIPPMEVGGDVGAETLVLGWGGTAGAILSAVERMRGDGVQLAYAHLRHLNPFPSNLGEILGRYKRVIIPEINSGQLRMLIRGMFLVDARGVNVIQGRGFHVDELVEGIQNAMGDKS
ncbi:MAG: 2-oxoacid:acceptor oxidoreductase subunit alpha [Phycisphaerales bacterium]|nr:2-oxoacid:acceptor oxidoreductase subunit alpha [Phycisphaerales bacterium]